MRFPFFRVVDRSRADAGNAADEVMAPVPRVTAVATRELFDGLRGATAAHASDDCERALGTLGQRPTAALAMSVKLPFCAAHCLCCERDVLAAQSDYAIDAYVDDLVREIGLVGAQVGAAHELLELHLGGGSASELNEAQLLRLGDAIRARFSVPAEAAWTAECDPRRLGSHQIELMRAVGFNRITLGVLDIDERVQSAIGRRQSAALVDDVCDRARAQGIECITLDLMLGLPHQQPDRWRHTLAQVVAMAPERVTIARYRHRPMEVPAQCAIDAGALPDATATRLLADAAVEVLCGAGYRWIGCDQFVLEDDELAAAAAEQRLRRSLLAYSATPPLPLLGIGCGAVGEIGPSIYWNHTALETWRAAVRAGRLPVGFARAGGELERRRRRAVERLLCEQALPFEAVRGGLEEGYLRVARHEADGLVVVDEAGLRVTPAGRHQLALLCAELQEAVAVPSATPLCA